jgi:hypothetical protein
MNQLIEDHRTLPAIEAMHWLHSVCSRFSTSVKPYNSSHSLWSLDLYRSPADPALLLTTLTTKASPYIADPLVMLTSPTSLTLLTLRSPLTLLTPITLINPITSLTSLSRLPYSLCSPYSTHPGQPARPYGFTITAILLTPLSSFTSLAQLSPLRPLTLLTTYHTPPPPVYLIVLSLLIIIN